MLAMRACAAVGPSPRARGAGRLLRGQAAAAGTIPAFAGSSFSLIGGSSPMTGPSPRARGAVVSVPSRLRRSPDHPRVRGEQIGWNCLRSPNRGPSPRARGAVASERDRLDDAGTIPACAGSRTPSSATSTRRGDHPRVRGEQAPAGGVERCPAGPSPRARGAARAASATLPQARTIPACAGSSATPAACRAT